MKIIDTSEINAQIAQKAIFDPILSPKTLEKIALVSRFIIKDGVPYMRTDAEMLEEIERVKSEQQ